MISPGREAWRAGKRNLSPESHQSGPLSLSFKRGQLVFHTALTGRDQIQYSLHWVLKPYKKNSFKGGNGMNAWIKWLVKYQFACSLFLSLNLQRHYRSSWCVCVRMSASVSSAVSLPPRSGFTAAGLVGHSGAETKLLMAVFPLLSTPLSSLLPSSLEMLCGLSLMWW